MLPPVVYLPLNLYKPLEINTQKCYPEVARLFSEFLVNNCPTPDFL